jgi:hypothetical protein
MRMAANNLFPVFAVPEAAAEDGQTIQRYNPAPLWDYERGDFVLSGARQLQYGTGFDAWVFWCVKSIMTQHRAHLGYSSNAGVEAMEAFREKDRHAAESALERTVSEALLADPMGRTTQVRNFRFAWENGGDSLFIECEVIGTEGNSAAIKAQIR